MLDSILGADPAVRRIQSAAARILHRIGVTANVATTSAVRPVVRHNVANVLFTGLTPEEAHVSSYFTVCTHVGLDHFGRYRDILVPDGNTWLIKHRKVTTDWAAPDSTMARRPPAG